MTTFFNSISDVLNQPEDASVRNLAVLKGEALAQEIRGLASRVSQVRADLNDQVRQTADDINRLNRGNPRAEHAGSPTTEGGSTSKSDAVGLRDQRGVALEDLANLIDIHVAEQPNGIGDGLHRRGLPRDGGGVAARGSGQRGRPRGVGGLHPNCGNQCPAGPFGRASSTACWLPATTSSAAFWTNSTTSRGRWPTSSTRSTPAGRGSPDTAS